MLTESSVDQIFENTWKDFTESRDTDKKELVRRYLEALLKEADQRSDRVRPNMDAFIDAARAQLGEKAVQITKIGFVVALPNQSFAVTAKHENWFLLSSMNCYFSTDVTIMVPQQAALLMDAAGHYLQKAGDRWDAYINRCEEETRIREIVRHYGREKKELLDRFAIALADENLTEDFSGAYKRLLLAEAEELGTPLPEYEAERLTDVFQSEGQKAKKVIIQRRAAADKAREKRIAEKQEDGQRYQRELQHLVETIGVEPRITRRTPMGAKHFIEYTFPLANGQTLSIKDHYRNPARVEEFATTFMRELQTILPYLSTKVRVTQERGVPTPAMLKYYRVAALKALPADSPFKSLVEGTEIPQNTVSYHVNQRSFICQYYFLQGNKRGLRLSLPLTLSAEQVKDFKNHFRALIRFDKSMRRWREPLEYGFDVPEKK